MTQKLILEFIGDPFTYIPFALGATLYAFFLIRGHVPVVDSIWYPKNYVARCLMALLAITTPHISSWKPYYGNYTVAAPVDKTTDTRDSVREILKK